MIDRICEHNSCTGCSACKNICSKKAITMVEDNEGFKYPQIDKALCVNCNLCRNTCPVNHFLKDDKNEPLCFAAQNMDDDIRLRSSSGGVFSLLAEYILTQNGIVYGAGFDENFYVLHKSCNTKEGLDELRRSKYVQSDCQYVYREIKDNLIQGQKVLFTGTPCQVAGILAYLGKDYPNLYLQDFICHGVPSPLVWRKYLKYREKEGNSKINQVLFRNKTFGWKYSSLKFHFSSGKDYIKKITEDMYLRSFIMHMNLRKSCSQCSFKQVHRQADITLADLWGTDQIVPAFNDDKGTSAVFIHSKKGRELFDIIKKKIRYQEIPFDEAIKYNQPMIKSIKHSGLRKKFLRDVNMIEFDRLFSKYCGNSILAKIRRKISGIGRKKDDEK